MLGSPQDCKNEGTTIVFTFLKSSSSIISNITKSVINAQVGESHIHNALFIVAILYLSDGFKNLALGPFPNIIVGLSVIFKISLIFFLLLT